MSITNDAALRPKGMKADYFGAMKVLIGDGANGPILVHTKYVLEWLGISSLPSPKVWVSEVEDEGILASFTVNNRL